MNRRIVATGLASLGVLGGAALLLSWFLYQAWTGTLEPTFVNAVGAAITAFATLVLALLTAWYANSTRHLLATSQAQVSVMRASYAPVLDVTVDPASDHLQLSVTNQGEGTATDVTLTIDIDTGDHVYRYIGHLTRPIRPGEQVTGASPKAQVTLGSMSGSSLDVMPVFSVDSTTEALPELLDSLADNGHRVVTLQLRASCNDVIGDQAYRFTPLERKALSVGAGSVDAAFGQAATGGTVTVQAPPPESLRDYPAVAVRKAKRLLPLSNDEPATQTSVYEEDIDVSLV